MAVLRRSSLHLLHRHVARRYASSATAPRLTIGIRREDPLRIWERRCPLTPDLVNELVEKDGVDVLIEDCDRRVWNTSTFVQVCSLSRCTPLKPCFSYALHKLYARNSLLPWPWPSSVTFRFVTRTWGSTRTLLSAL